MDANQKISHVREINAPLFSTVWKALKIKKNIKVKLRTDQICTPSQNILPLKNYTLEWIEIWNEIV